MEKHLEWWQSLTDLQKEKIKEQYHKEYQLKIIKDLSDSEVKLVYNRRLYYDF